MKQFIAIKLLNLARFGKLMLGNYRRVIRENYDFLPFATLVL